MARDFPPRLSLSAALAVTAGGLAEQEGVDGARERAEWRKAACQHVGGYTVGTARMAPLLIPQIFLH